MPIVREEDKHVFGILSDNSRKTILQNMKKLHHEKLNSSKWERPPCESEMLPPVDWNFVKAFNDDEEHREEYIKIVDLILMHLRRMGHRNHLPRGSNADVPKVRACLAILCQCNSARVQRNVFSHLIWSLETAILDDFEVASLFRLGHHFIKSLNESIEGPTSIFNPLVVTRNVRLLKCLVLVTERLDYYKGVGVIQGVCEEHLQQFIEQCQMICKHVPKAEEIPALEAGFTFLFYSVSRLCDDSNLLEAEEDTSLKLKKMPHHHPFPKQQVDESPSHSAKKILHMKYQKRCNGIINETATFKSKILNASNRTADVVRMIKWLSVIGSQDIVGVNSMTSFIESILFNWDWQVLYCFVHSLADIVIEASTSHIRKTAMRVLQRLRIFHHTPTSSGDWRVRHAVVEALIRLIRSRTDPGIVNVAWSWLTERGNLESDERVSYLLRHVVLTHLEVSELVHDTNVESERICLKAHTIEQLVNVNPMTSFVLSGLIIESLDRKVFPTSYVSGSIRESSQKVAGIEVAIPPLENVKVTNPKTNRCRKTSSKKARESSKISTPANQIKESKRAALDRVEDTLTEVTYKDVALWDFDKKYSFFQIYHPSVRGKQGNRRHLRRDAFHDLQELIAEQQHEELKLLIASGQQEINQFLLPKLPALECLKTLDTAFTTSSTQ